MVDVWRFKFKCYVVQSYRWRSFLHIWLVVVQDGFLQGFDSRMPSLTHPGMGHPLRRPDPSIAAAVHGEQWKGVHVSGHEAGKDGLKILCTTVREISYTETSGR